MIVERGLRSMWLMIGTWRDFVKKGVELRFNKSQGISWLSVLLVSIWEELFSMELLGPLCPCSLMIRPTTDIKSRRSRFWTNDCFGDSRHWRTPSRRLATRLRSSLLAWPSHCLQEYTHISDRYLRTDNGHTSVWMVHILCVAFYETKSIRLLIENIFGYKIFSEAVGILASYDFRF
jgi:hypothetical protein